VRIPELVLAVGLAAMGVRSLVHWVRHPLDAAGIGEQALFALHVTARVVMWFALAGLFTLWSVVETTDPVTGRNVPAVGRAFVDAARAFSWMYLVLLAIAAIQFVTGWFLGHRPVR